MPAAFSSATMKLFLIRAPVIGTLLLLGSLGAAAAETGEASEGADELFLTLKCQLCHSVPMAGIEAKAKSEKVRGADLGTAESKLSFEEMAEFLQRQSEIDGQRHKKEFKGTGEELEVVVGWLLGLSREARAGDGPEVDTPEASSPAGEG